MHYFLNPLKRVFIKPLSEWERHEEVKAWEEGHMLRYILKRDRALFKQRATRRFYQMVRVKEEKALASVVVTFWERKGLNETSAA